MSTEQRHIIHRQVIELRLASRNDAFRIQSRASQLFQQEVAQRLDEHFSRLGLGESMLRIPRLEIELGRISLENLDRDFVNLCALSIQREVERILRQAGLETATTRETGNGREPAGVLISASEYRLQALRLFLVEGIVPPPFQGKRWEALETEWMEVLEYQSQSAIEMLRDLAARIPLSMERMARQFSPQWIEALLKRLMEQESPIQPTEARQQPDPGPAANRLETLPALPQLWWRALPEPIRLQLRNWLASQAQPPPFTADRTALVRLQAGVLRALLAHPRAQWEAEIRRLLASMGPSSRPPGQEGTAGHAGQKASPAGASATKTEIAGAEKISVRNAGIVILHPFLPAFFESLGYLDGRRWKNKELQERAMHLLLYLATGEAQLGEYEFILAKLLCGWPQNEAVGRFLVLTETEKQEATALLDAVLKHWAALKSTSQGLLQEGFLQRMGLLRKARDSWKLQLEHQAQDVLLDRLPWGISIIQLPWMMERLTVEW